MPTLILEDVPAEVYERLQQRASATQRTIPEELLSLLRQALRTDDSTTPRLPEFIPIEEIAAPCDLPRSSHAEPVSAVRGQPRLPDSLPSEDQK